MVLKIFFMSPWVASYTYLNYIIMKAELLRYLSGLFHSNKTWSSTLNMTQVTYNYK